MSYQHGYVYEKAPDTLPSGTPPPDAVRPIIGVREAIVLECDELLEMLLAKNEAYGNSALEPVRVFSKADPEEQLRVRLDDKLSRLIKGHDAGEDVELDIMGYLILLRVARRMRAR